MDLEVADMAPTLRPALKKRLETYRSELTAADSKLRKSASAVGSRWVWPPFFYIFFFHV
jgi:hypothetical protein